MVKLNLPMGVTFMKEIIISGIFTIIGAIIGFGAFLLQIKHTNYEERQKYLRERREQYYYEALDFQHKTLNMLENSNYFEVYARDIDALDREMNIFDIKTNMYASIEVQNQILKMNSVSTKFINAKNLPPQINIEGYSEFANEYGVLIDLIRKELKIN